MLVRSKCLHRAVATEYAEVCKEDPGFHDFLLDVFPCLDITQCSRCDLYNPTCGGENSEFHPDPDHVILDLERMRQGFCEDDHTYTQRQLSLLGYCSSFSDKDGKHSKPFSLRKAVSIDLELLTGDPRVDRFQVSDALRRRGDHLQDDYSVQERIDNDLVEVS